MHPKLADLLAKYPCCGTPEWRGLLCQYHQGYVDGLEDVEGTEEGDRSKGKRLEGVTDGRSDGPPASAPPLPGGLPEKRTGVLLAAERAHREHPRGRGQKMGGARPRRVRRFGLLGASRGGGPAVTVRDARTPDQIAEQHAKGWPDFHPEDYCHQCGDRNPRWWAPEWPALMGTHAGILCPRCFALNDPESLWVVTRWERQEPGRSVDLAAFLRSVSDLGDDEADRVARCLLDYWQAKGATHAVEDSRG